MPVKRKLNDRDEGGEEKRPGRPRTLSPDLDKRHQLRCASRDFDAWSKRADRLGFPNVSSWLRKVANDALKRAAR